MIRYFVPSRFVEAIRSGAKRQGIFGPRLRHAWAGEPIEIMQSGGSLITPVAPALCTASLRIEITWADASICRIVTGGVPVLDLNRFACAEGYEGLADMSLGWPHMVCGTWSGQLIEWEPFGPEAAFAFASGPALSETDTTRSPVRAVRAG